jgi:hypothetical protein
VVRTRITSLSFPTVDKSVADRFIVPTGYTARVIYATGDPIAAVKSTARMIGLANGGVA